MELGVRQIRSAGKGSGSIELTLPGELRQLVGLRCRITLHDGEQPDIVLRPDVSGAAASFARLWRALAGIFAQHLAGREEEIFPASAFQFGLLPAQGQPGTPYLCWQDGLALSAGGADAAAVGRCIFACAAQLGGELGIAGELGPAFGAVCGFLAVGRLLFPDWQAPCDIAACELAAGGAWRPGVAWAGCPDAGHEMFWRHLAPQLSACVDLFTAWSAPGSRYRSLSAAWRRGHSIEMNRG